MLPAGDVPNLPEQPKPTLSKELAAEAAIAAVMEKQAAASEAAVKESFDIVDPSIPQSSAAAPSPTPAAPPSAAAAKTIPGASVIPESLLGMAAELGLSAKQVEALGVDAVRGILARTARAEPPVQSQPQFAFDPYTGQRLAPAGGDVKTPEVPALEDPDEPVIDPATGEAQKWTWDPALKRAFEKQQKAIDEARTEAKQLRDEREQEKAVVQQRRDQRAFQTLEKLFQDDKEFHDVFGSGPLSAIAGTDAADARFKVVKTADGMIQRGEATTWADAYEASKIIHHRERILGKREAAAEQRVYELARNAQGQYISPPTNTEAGDDLDGLPKGEVRALRRLQKMMNQR